MSDSSQRVRQGRRLLAVAPVAVIAALALASCSANENPAPGRGVGTTVPTVFTPAPSPSATGSTIPKSSDDVGIVDESTIVANLKDASGQSVGTANFAGAGAGTTVTVDVFGLTPGYHSMAVTSAGVCDAADSFDSAGDVLNDSENVVTGMPRDGDLPTLLVDSDGNGKFETISSGLNVAELLNDPGTALVIGSGADSASARIACGVLEIPAR